MKFIRFYIVFLICLSSCAASQPTYLSCEKKWEIILKDGNLSQKYQFLINKCKNSFKDGLLRVTENHVVYSYYEARKLIYSQIDNIEGYVYGVYSDIPVKTNEIPNTYIMNTEHSWPQSLGGGEEIIKSDIHHLYPVLAYINTGRSNHPFCEVEKVIRRYYDSTLGYSKFGTKCFEPRNSHKGDVARTMFYISIRYNMLINYEQEYFFRKWNKLDPPSNKEIKRNNDIEKFQENRNPFIDEPRFSDLIDNF